MIEDPGFLERDTATKFSVQENGLAGNEAIPPLLTSISVKSCHLFMATIHLSSRRRQLYRVLSSVFVEPRTFAVAAHLTSTTSFSFPICCSKAFSLSNENLAEGNRYEVTMTCQ